jgi:hypothetical protein
VLDVERIIAPDRHPSDAGRAQVVPGQGLARAVGVVKLGAGDARETQEVAVETGRPQIRPETHASSI